MSIYKLLGRTRRPAHRITPPPRTTRHRVRAHGPPAPARGRGRQWPDTARLCAAAHARATETTRPAIVAHAATGRADAAEHEHAPGPVAGACRKAGCHSPAQGHTRQRGVAERSPPAASCPAGEPPGTRMGSTRLATLPRPCGISPAACIFAICSLLCTGAEAHRPGTGVPTVEEAAAEVLAQQRPGWRNAKYGQDWPRSLRAAILFLERVNDVTLLLVDPARDGHDEEPQHLGTRRHTGRAEQRLSAVTNVATRRASSVESARRTASIGFLDSTATTRNYNTWGKGDIRGEPSRGSRRSRRRDPASVQRRISPSDGVDRVLGQYDVAKTAGLSPPPPDH